MSIGESVLAPLRHPRLAALAASAQPAWLWSADGTEILWTNAAGAAIFGAKTIVACLQLRFEAKDRIAAQIINLAATLPGTGQERLERLRGLSAGFGRALTCACSRIPAAGGKAAILIAATERAGPALPTAERVRRLFANADEAVAVFAADGALVYANSAAEPALAGATTLAALGLNDAAGTALATGAASGRLDPGNGDAQLIRIGGDAAHMLALIFEPQTRSAAATPAAAKPVISPAPPAALLPAAPRSDPAAPGPGASSLPAERRHPLRFVWQVDSDGRFTVGSDEFIELVGPRTMAAFGRPWHEIADDLQLDPEGRVASALATRETWSGLVVPWPVDDSDARLPVELSGLPVFDRDRTFRGYRGFGVCRDIARTNALARARRESLADAAAPEPLQPAQNPGPADVTPVDSMPTEAAEEPAAPPPPANVVPFWPATAAEPTPAPSLTAGEHDAFRELAQQLTARLRNAAVPDAGERGPPTGDATDTAVAMPAATVIEHILLDRIPIGILVYRHDAVLYANRHFLDWSGYESPAAIEAAGGLDRLFVAPVADALADSGEQALSILTRTNEKLPVGGRMFTVPWNGSSAMALILTNSLAETGRNALRQPAAAHNENHEIKSILDLVSDGVLTLDAGGRIMAANVQAASLLGQAGNALAGRLFDRLLAPASERAARESFERLIRGGAPSSSLDIEARAGEQQRPVPLAMTLTRIGDRYYAVLRDIAGRRQVEDELRKAKRELQRTAAAKAEFLSKISHEIRTPLNTMTGFAEVIMAERFGPIGNERYREYVKDIHGAGTQLVSMLNDLLDLSKVESGQIDLNFANVNLNDLTQQCVGIMQPQANRARIIIRTALAPGLPLVVADARSLRQIVLNLLSHSIKGTGPGGQVIVSTAYSDAKEAVLRVRDTGAGMTEKDIQAALEPFEQTAIASGAGGTSFGLPLTKALAEANRANFDIKSAPNAGTLVEIAFPSSRVVTP
jgi:PAS domain S-box-containing protein